MCLLGLDIGSSGCKATIIDYEGIVLQQSYKEYLLISPRPGFQEMNPNEVWESVKEVIAGVLADYHGEPVVAIGISSFGEAFVALDQEGNVLTNSMIYTDIRGIEEAKLLEQMLGSDRVHQITGTSIHAMYSICKMMWIKRNMPETFAKVWKFLLFADFILFKLGADPYTDYSLAARTMAFDVTRKVWSEEILHYAGIRQDQLGQPVQAGTAIGTIQSKVAAELGLPGNVLLVVGGHDQTCAALGAGVIGPGSAVDGMGTTECITPVFERPIISSIMAQSSFACVPHVIQDMYVTYGFIFTSGSMLKWYRDNFGYEFVQEAARKNQNVFELMISQAADEPSDLYVLPHFAGAATPYMDLNAKGAIVGLSVYSTPRDIIKAILEGITFEMMVNVERMEQAGIFINDLRAVGGLANSESYLQLKADMMGKRVSSLYVAEAGTLGVTILAGKAAGIFNSYEAAVKQLVKVKREYYPDHKRREIYLERFERYKRMYSAVKGIYN
jgi:xylulokinase